MDVYVSEKDIDSFENADNILTFFLTFLDIIILLIYLLHLKSENHAIQLLKLKLISIFAIDIIIRLLYIKTYYHANNIFKEIFFSGMPTSQFYLILSFLDQILNNIYISNTKYIVKQVNSIELSFLFFLFIFSYDKFSYSFSKHLCFLESIINLGCVFKLYEYLRDIILIIVEGINNRKVEISLIYSFIKNLPLSSLEFYVIFYCLKIISLFIENSLYLIYIKIIILIVKETSKYFVFFILGSIIFILTKYYNNKNPSDNTGINNINYGPEENVKINN